MCHAAGWLTKSCSLTIFSVGVFKQLQIHILLILTWRPFCSFCFPFPPQYKMVTFVVKTKPVHIPLHKPSTSNWWEDYLFFFSNEIRRPTLIRHPSRGRMWSLLEIILFYRMSAFFGLMPRFLKVNLWFKKFLFGRNSNVNYRQVNVTKQVASKYLRGNEKTPLNALKILLQLHGWTDISTLLLMSLWCWSLILSSVTWDCWNTEPLNSLSSHGKWALQWPGFLFTLPLSSLNWVLPLASILYSHCFQMPPGLCDAIAILLGSIGCYLCF